MQAAAPRAAAPRLAAAAPRASIATRVPRSAADLSRPAAARSDLWRAPPAAARRLSSAAAPGLAHGGALDASTAASGNGRSAAAAAVAGPGTVPAELEKALPTRCAGCGVHLQREDPQAPGYYQIPRRVLEAFGLAERHRSPLAASLRAAGGSSQPMPEDGSALGGEGATGDGAGARGSPAGAPTLSSSDPSSGIGEGSAGGMTTVALPSEFELWEGSLGQVGDDAVDADVESRLNGRRARRGEEGGRRPPPGSGAHAALAPPPGAHGLALSSPAASFPPPSSLALSKEELKDLVRCARCRSLSHHGRVQDETVESSLPDFDFARVVGARIHLKRGRPQVVVAVLDASDLEGSMPSAALRSISDPALRSLDDEAFARARQSAFELVVVLTKADLLPSSMGDHTLLTWVRARLAARGMPRPATVALVSAKTGLGVRDLLRDLRRRVGPFGDAWMVGTQNAGKSSLVNALRKAAGAPGGRGAGGGGPTAAARPGTTLGVLGVRGVFEAEGARCWDTPGVPLEHSLASWLSADELALVLPAKPLKPRTFRLGEGYGVAIGGVARVDVLRADAQTIYLTPWVSQALTLHLGKSERKEELERKHLGKTLIPPFMPQIEGAAREKAGTAHARGREEGADIDARGRGDEAAGSEDGADAAADALATSNGADAAADALATSNGADAAADALATRDGDAAHGPGVAPLAEPSAASEASVALPPPTLLWPALVPTDVTVSGVGWERAGADVSIAGLGWISVTARGDATLRVWTPPGVDVRVRQPQLRERNKRLERPGFAMGITGEKGGKGGRKK